MNSTHNDLPKATRSKVIEILSAQLADALDLKSQLKFAHWNVKGPSFIALHKMFDEIASDADEYADDLAERAVQLGGTADGSVRTVAKKTRLAAHPTTSKSEADHLRAVLDALSTFAASTRKGIDSTDKAGDKDTSDLFTGISRGVDKWVWMVEAHLA